MDSMLVIIGFCCMLIGRLSSRGAWTYELDRASAPLFYNCVPANYWILSITLLITIITSILEYIIPSRGTKRFGGSSYGIWGTNIGLLLAFLVLSHLDFLSVLFRRFNGELLYDSKTTNALESCRRIFYWISSF
jgi:uncharacterized protein YqgC (DUF456 family)